MSRLRPDAPTNPDGPTADAAVPSELDLTELRFYELVDMYRTTLAMEESDERTAWLKQIETEMSAVGAELDRLLRKR